MPSLSFCLGLDAAFHEAVAAGDLGRAAEQGDALRRSGCLSILRKAQRARFKADVANIPNPITPTVRTTTTSIFRRRGTSFTPFDDPFGGGFGGGVPSTPDPTNPLLAAACAILGLSDCTLTNVIAAGGAALLGLGGDDEDVGDPAVPGDTLGTGDLPVGGNGECPGLFKVKIGDRCVDLSALPPGGDPATTALQFTPVRGLNGAGFAPMTETRQVRVCPPDHVLGKDNVCYDSLPRTRRKWDPGMKPLMTGGDRAAIRKAARAARKLKRSKKQLKKASRALEKVS